MGKSGLTAGDFEMSGNLQVNAQFTSKYAAALGLLRGKIDYREFRTNRLKRTRKQPDLP